MSLGKCIRDIIDWHWVGGGMDGQGSGPLAKELAGLMANPSEKTASEKAREKKAQRK